MSALSLEHTRWLEQVGEGLARVRGRIAEAAAAAGRDAAEVHLLAVSKTRPPEAVWAAWRCGQRWFGENRVQEGQAKIQAVEALLRAAAAAPQDAAEQPPDAAALRPAWHLVGHVQTNKARQAAEGFSCVHSLDSVRLAEALAAARERQGAAGAQPLDVLLQVNFSREATKSGVEEEAVLHALAQAVLRLPALRLRGLMCLPPPGLGEAPTRRSFARVRKALEGLQTAFSLGAAANTLSLGMSGDLEWAIAEGATIVRVGQAVFGTR